MAVFLKDVAASKTEMKLKLDRLKNMDLFVLDNSLRETTVASLRAHTVESKRRIYDLIKECKFKHFIIESFNGQNRMGDLFVQELIKQGEDLSNAFGFSEVWEVIDKDGIPQPDTPIGLIKCRDYNIPNVFLEFDLMYFKIDYKTFDMGRVCQYFIEKVRWIRKNISQESKILVNMRDFSQCMGSHPERIGHFVKFVSSLSESERIFGLAFEDLGKVLPEELGGWTKAVRNEMVRCGWDDGHLLFHQHEQWGLAPSANLEVLAKGATGMWAGVCVEGAAMGHADTCTALLNLIRLGNTKVQETYNCQYLRKAARSCTKITTGAKALPKQPIYGDRALDLVFGFLFSDPTQQGGFDLAEFFGMKKEVRISNMANADMILLKLNNVFGENPEFTIEMAGKMKEKMLTNAGDGRKEEYNSKAGLAILFDQAGGSMTPEMAVVVEAAAKSTPFIQTLIAEIKKEWDHWDERDGSKDGKISFNDFYNGFMAPYFGCYRCDDSQKALRAINMDGDDGIDWEEFKLYLVWAGRQYPLVEDAQKLLDKAFRKGIIPAMSDEIEKNRRM